MKEVPCVQTRRRGVVLAARTNSQRQFPLNTVRQFGAQSPGDDRGRSGRLDWDEQPIIDSPNFHEAGKSLGT